MRALTEPDDEAPPEELDEDSAAGPEMPDPDRNRPLKRKESLVVERSTIAYRYTATLERLGDFDIFEVPPEWLPDELQINELTAENVKRPAQ